MSVERSSLVEANAAKESRIPREQLEEAAQVKPHRAPVSQELKQQNPLEEPVHEQEQVSTTDPDSTYATKGGTPARLGYYDNYLVNNQSCVIVGVQATAARMSQETVAAQDMLTRFAQWQGGEPESVAGDTTYGNGEFLQWLADRSTTPYMRTRDSIHRKISPFYGPERFTYQPESNSYRCPAGQQLNYGRRNLRNRTYAYIGTRKRCGACALKAQCTSRAFRFLAIHMDEPARRRARELSGQELAARFAVRKTNICTFQSRPVKTSAIEENARLLLQNYGGFLPRQGHKYAEQIKEASAEMEQLRQDLVAAQAPTTMRRQRTTPSHEGRSRVVRWEVGDEYLFERIPEQMAALVRSLVQRVGSSKSS